MKLSGIPVIRALRTKAALYTINQTIKNIIILTEKFYFVNGKDIKNTNYLVQDIFVTCGFLLKSSMISVISVRE